MQKKGRCTLIFLVPYAYDRMPSGKPREGVPTNRLGSKARCDVLIGASQQYRKQAGSNTRCRFVLTAGYTKESPAIPTEDVKESIAMEMSDYLRSQNVWSTHVHPIAWGTLEETRESIRIISHLSSLNWVIHPRIFVSTNLGHLPRVWLCWLFLKPKGWRFRFVLANHSFTPKEWFQETAKFFQYLYCFVFKKW